MMGIISFSTNCRAVCRTSFSSSFNCESKSMKSTPQYPAILLSSFLAAAKRPARAAMDGALCVRPHVIDSQENDLLRAPFPECVPFGRNSDTAIVASPRKGQQQTVPATGRCSVDELQWRFSIVADFLCATRLVTFLPIKKLVFA